MKLRFWPVIFLLAAAGAAAFADGGLAIRFCENRPDRVVLEIVRTRAAENPPADSETLVAVPSDAKCFLAGTGAKCVRFVGEAVLREIKIVSLAVGRLRPGKQLEYPARLELVFKRAGAPHAPSRPRPSSPWFEPVFKALVINYPFPDSYRRMPEIRSPDEGTVGLPVPGGCRVALKVEVEPPGRVRVPLERISHLLGRRFSADEARRRLRLWHCGRPWPFAIERSRDPSDGPAFCFDAEVFSSRYTPWDVYWIFEADGEDGAGVSGAKEKRPCRSTLPPANWRIERRTFERDLRNPRKGADIIYICHPAFARALAPLARWRRREGMRVAVVASDAVADAFNFGRDEPQAIRRFLAWTYAHWPPPAPAYAVLVGDASADPKSTAPEVARNFISTVYDGNGADPPAHDDAYVEFLGEGRLPQMMLGRLSVNEPGQMEAIAEKLVAHERRARPGPWRGRVLLLADNGYERLFAPSVVRWIPPHLDTPRIDVRDFPYVDHYNLARTKISPACREAVVRHLDEGAAAVHYVGHGGVSLVSHEKMFFWTDVARLTNFGRLPFFVQVSCRTGGFDWPEQEWKACLSELLLQRRGAGALGVFSASRALYGDEAYLQRCLFRAYCGKHSLTLGEVKMLAKVPYLLNRPEKDFINSYNLLGDPASKLVFPRPFERFEIAPRRIEARPGASVAVAGRLPVGRRGRVVLWWRDPSGRKHEIARTVTTRSGELKAKAPLPDDAVPGRWRLLAYATVGLFHRLDYQGAASVEVVEVPRTYPDDPAGRPDLAFAGGGFEFADDDLTEGYTIMVRAVVENRGTRRSRPTRLTWEWAPLGQEGAKSPSAKVCTVEVPALYPTQKKALSLRWDPFGVVGPIVNVLTIAPCPGEERIENNRTSRTLRIKTKPDLTLAAPPRWQIRRGRLRLALAVANLGETAAEGVEVKVWAGDSDGPRVSLAESLPVASRIEGGARSPERRWTLKWPRKVPPLDYLYIEVVTAEPVSEISKKNNRFRVRVFRARSRAVK